MQPARSGDREEHRPDHRDADRAAELLHRVQHAGRRADLVVLDAREHEVEQRREHRAHADAGEQLRAGQRPGARAVLARRAAGRARRAASRRGRRAATGRPKRGPSSAGADTRADRGAERPRDQRQAGLDRAEALAQLQVEAEDEHQADHPGEEHERASPARRRTRACGTGSCVTSGDACGLAALEHDEAGQHDQRSRAMDDERPRGPVRPRGPGSAGTRSGRRPDSPTR